MTSVSSDSANPSIQLSAEQQAVVHATDPRLTVVAAAGAGKTRVLVDRYLRHVVEEGIRPDQILTITFTKKAASEMKRRIVDQLLAQKRFEDAQIAETGPIQTLHSFCERTLRENSLEAGLDPQFEILDGARMSRLLTTCVREALAELDEDTPHVEHLLIYLAGKRAQYGATGSPYAKLESAVQSVLGTLRGTGLSRDQLLDWHRSPQALAAHWEQIAISAASQERPGSDEALKDINGGTLAERLKAAVKATQARTLAWTKSDGQEAEDEARLHTCGLVQLACSAWWRMERELNAAQTLDFTALEERAVKLLAESEVTRARIAKQYPVVMVDEAQDLNPVQYRLLDALAPSRLMLVGDAQQSIYGFRQADVTLFENRVAQPGARRLSRNYRSSPGILNFVDFAFGTLWAGKYVPMGVVQELDLNDTSKRSVEGVEVWRQAKGDWDAVGMYLRQLHDEGVPYGDVAVLVRDGTGTTQMEDGLRSAGVPYRIAGGSERFYTRLEVRDLSNALRAVADPYDDFALLACLRSPVVGLSLDSVVMASVQRPVVEHLATFVPPVPEDGPKLARFRQWFEPLRGVADRLAAWEVLAELFAHSELLPTLARREGRDALLANVRKLLSLATKEPELGPLEYAERIREIQDLRHKEGEAPAEELDADVVTLMTIHKAKGLEFPVVILPQTDKRLVGPARDVMIDARNGVVVTKFGNGKSLLYNLLDERRKKRDEEEEMRVLYVALTRAKSRLCICLFPRGNDKTVSKMLSENLDKVSFDGLRERDSEFVPAMSPPPG